MSSLGLSELLLIFVALASVLFVSRQKWSRRKLPPSPPGLPFFGNMFQLPHLARFRKLKEWALKYGEIYCLHLGPKTFVVVNTPEAAYELMVKRAHIYSARPHSHVAFELVSDRQRIAFMQPDDVWKDNRKKMLSVVGPSAMKRVHRYEELESRVLLKDLVDYGDRAVREYEPPQPGTYQYVPENHWYYLIRRFTTSNIMNIVYAERIHKLHNVPHVTKIFDILSNFLRVAEPGQYLADTFPILQLAPDWLAKWRTEAKAMHAWEMELWGSFLEEHKANIRGGLTRDCFVSKYLRDRADAGHDDLPGTGLTSDGWMRDKALAYTAGSLIETASDTTASTLQIFLLYMISNPDALRKAQEEIDRVIGDHRMPTSDDEEKLPYLVACIKETMRMRPASANGVPHASEEDDVYKGYFIPKGSIILGNLYAMQMDPQRFPDPAAFKPERYYQPGQATSWRSGPEAKERDNWIFGWGKRSCLGYNFALASVFIAAARILWGLDMIAPTDPKTGKSMLPDLDDEESTWINETVNAPKIFPIIWRPRNERRTHLINRNFEEAQREWQLLGVEMDVR